MNGTTPIILASRSPYRRDLLKRLVPDFQQLPADIDEHARENEATADYVARLSREKAQEIANRQEGPALLIGSDQAAELDGRILGKPGDFDRGVEMLCQAAGRTVVFYTGLCLLDSDQDRCDQDRCFEHLDITRVRFRDFGVETARAYLRKEAALDCAGSFRCEGLGISLFEGIDNQDPTALIGLPLIALARGLREFAQDSLSQSDN